MAPTPENPQSWHIPQRPREICCHHVQITFKTIPQLHATVPPLLQDSSYSNWPHGFWPPAVVGSHCQLHPDAMGAVQEIRGTLHTEQQSVSESLSYNSQAARLQNLWAWSRNMPCLQPITVHQPRLHAANGLPVTQPHPSLPTVPILRFTRSCFALNSGRMPLDLRMPSRMAFRWEFERSSSVA